MSNQQQNFKICVQHEDNYVNVVYKEKNTADINKYLY